MLYASQPLNQSVTPEGWTEKYDFGAGSEGPGPGRDARLGARTAKETYLGNRRI